MFVLVGGDAAGFNHVNELWWMVYQTNLMLKLCLGHTLHKRMKAGKYVPCMHLMEKTRVVLEGGLIDAPAT